MDSLAAVGSRRLNLPKAYLFMFGLILAAILSIYKSSSGKDFTVQSFLEQQRYNKLFAPSRLDEDIIEEVDNKEDETSIEDGEKADTKAETEEQQKKGGSKTAEDKPVNINKPLNIVLLYADDMRHDSIGIAGTQPVETPFLDELSKTKAMRFTHNCVSTSVCWISRASLHSGVYFSRHQALRPRDSNWYDDYWETSYPSVLKKEGYYVAHIGTS